jgi:hypothetical protein
MPAQFLTTTPERIYPATGGPLAVGAGEATRHDTGSHVSGDRQRALLAASYRPRRESPDKTIGSAGVATDRNAAATSVSQPESSPRAQTARRPGSVTIWDGIVTEVDGDTFTATLQRDEEPQLTAEFLVESLSPDDRALLAPGAYFYVAVQRFRSRSGRTDTTSSVHFRRLPAWSRRGLENARVAGRARREELGFED